MPLSSWGRASLDSLRAATVALPIAEGEITVLRDPAEFYEVLMQLAEQVEERVVLSSLYLGTGDQERRLVECLTRRAEQRSLDVRTLMDHSRGTRGDKNSGTMLMPLLRAVSTPADVVVMVVRRRLTVVFRDERRRKVLGCRSTTPRT